jgi:hypothetical protein
VESGEIVTIYLEIRDTGKMEKATPLVACVVFGLLGLLWLARMLGGFGGMILMFVNSPLPWWVLTPAAIALIAGFVFLFKIRLARKSPNRKFVH